MHTAMFNMDRQQGPTVQHGELRSLSRGSLDGRGLGDNGCKCRCVWVPLLSPGNHHSIAHQ